MLNVNLYILYHKINKKAMFVKMFLQILLKM